MKKMMRVAMVLLVMGFIFSLTAEAFARDYSRGRGNPGFSDGFRRGTAIAGIGAGAYVVNKGIEVLDGVLNSVLYGTGAGCNTGGGYVGGGGTYSPYAQGYSRAVANIAWQEERRALQAYHNRIRAMRSMGSAQAYRDTSR